MTGYCFSRCGLRGDQALRQRDTQALGQLPCVIRESVVGHCLPSVVVHREQSAKPTSVFGTKREFSPERLEGRKPPHCRRSGPNVGSSPHCRPDSESRRRSAHDPHPTFGLDGLTDRQHIEFLCHHTSGRDRPNGRGARPKKTCCDPRRRCGRQGASIEPQKKTSGRRKMEKRS